jgi:hypothetical protein
MILDLKRQKAEVVPIGGTAPADKDGLKSISSQGRTGLV